MSLLHHFLPLLAVAVVASACSSDVLTVERDFTASTVVYELPPSVATETTDIVTSGVDFGLRTELSGYGIAEDELESVTVSGVRALIMDPGDSLTFADLSRGEIWLATAGLEPVLIAEKPAGATGVTADFLLTDPDLEAYLLGSTLDAIFRVEATAVPGPDVEIAFDITYRVVGGV